VRGIALDVCRESGLDETELGLSPLPIHAPCINMAHRVKWCCADSGEPAKQKKGEGVVIEGTHTWRFVVGAGPSCACLARAATWFDSIATVVFCCANIRSAPSPHVTSEDIGACLGRGWRRRVGGVR